MKDKLFIWEMLFLFLGLIGIFIFQNPLGLIIGGIFLIISGILFFTRKGKRNKK